MLNLAKEREDMTDLAALQRSLGVHFRDTSLLEQALVHSSYLNEKPGFAPTSNERLEFLGDAILGMIIAEKLYQDFPSLTEGEMTKMRAALVQRQTLARMAKTIELDTHLYLGRGEDASGGRQKVTNLAGAMESVIAAIFLDQGLSVAQDFTLRLLGGELQKVANEGESIDYKSELQELIQSRKQQPPTYHLVEATGPDHDRRFTVEIRLGDVVLGRGSGNSKKAAETEAARLTLKQLQSGFTL